MYAIRSYYAPRLGYHVVLRRIDGDAVDPGVKGAVAAELGQGPIGLQKRFLGNVEYLVRIMDVAGDELGQPMLVLQYQQIESLLVPLLYPCDKLLIRLLFPHPHRPLFRDASLRLLP